jgi:hypothetical protein
VRRINPRPSYQGKQGNGETGRRTPPSDKFRKSFCDISGAVAASDCSAELDYTALTLVPIRRRLFERDAHPPTIRLVEPQLDLALPTGPSGARLLLLEARRSDLGSARRKDHG